MRPGYIRSRFAPLTQNHVFSVCSCCASDKITSLLRITSLLQVEQRRSVLQGFPASGSPPTEHCLMSKPRCTLQRAPALGCKSFLGVIAFSGSKKTQEVSVKGAVGERQRAPPRSPASSSSVIHIVPTAHRPIQVLGR